MLGCTALAYTRRQLEWGVSGAKDKKIIFVRTRPSSFLCIFFTNSRGSPSHDPGENGRKNKNTVFRSERNNNRLAAIKTPSHHGITYSTGWV